MVILSVSIMLEFLEMLMNECERKKIAKMALYDHDLLGHTKFYEKLDIK